MHHGVLPRCGAGHAAQGRGRGASGPPARHPRPDRHRLTIGTRLGTSYEEAGVSIAAGEQAVERIKYKVRTTFRPELMGDIGGRSEERRVGEEWVSKCRSRGSPDAKNINPLLPEMHARQYASD